MSAANENPSFLGRVWNTLKRPSAKYGLGTILVVGFIGGIVFWGGFNWSMELTNNETFCISYHEMRDNVYQEYRNTVHYSNRTGVRATCPDCHVPKTWIHKVIRKIQASNELYHKVLGSIDTREKFEAHRLELAKHVWKTMKETDSRECRNCHSFEYMDFVSQEKRSYKAHQKAIDNNMTCIDCHKGIAHELPAGINNIDGMPNIGSDAVD